jgi:hypothetical protein
MMKNRSVPTDTVLPHVMYQCIPDALAWLGRVFGFVEHYRYGEPGGPVSGAQAYVGKAVIQLSPSSSTMWMRITHTPRLKARGSWKSCTKPSTANGNMSRWI